MTAILSVVLAAVAAAGMLALAVSLPHRSRRGWFLGVAVPLCGMVAWTYGDNPMVVWALQAVVGVIALAVTHPWWRDAGDAWRWGLCWLVMPTWLAGMVSAALMTEWTVAIQRAVYAGFAAVIVLVVVKARRDISLSVTAGFLSCLAALTLTGATQLLASQRWTVDNPFGTGMADRFWGGELLGYHPNFIALCAVVVAIRLGADTTLTRLQRGAALAVASGFLILTGSRTSFIVAFTAAVGFAIAYPRTVARARRAVTLAIAVLPLLLTGATFAVSGGVDLMLKDRYENPEASGGGFINRLLSGRVDIWEDILTDYASGSATEWLLGDTANARGVYYSITDPEHPEFDTQAKHTADNALVGALYRGGVVGLVGYLVGLFLLLWHCARRDAPLWVWLTVAALLVTGVTEDEIAQTAPAWLMLAAAEIAAVAAVRGRPDDRSRLESIDSKGAFRDVADTPR
ncbi:O-antigen ligase-like membrane protein [Stackebrandtia endophytica]|uniref:O-antigen ligase-like membrane protein n=1 Tax=Stackebrandtia endophytica TaxID=1496996 RepID=A0A543AX66_9ACTN|nr:O-antigen ligase family protein [Stackebrandtia endophytica]TQL77167.1 O-antigen ligase-like membrane protein [Stackebrandtia endophytica]